MATRTAPTRAAQDTTSTTGDWLRFARGGTIVMAAWAIAFLAYVQAFIPPIAMIGLVFLAFAPFLKGDRRKLGLAVAILSALAMAGNLEAILDDLQNPDSAPAFIFGLLSVVGGLIILVGGLSAFLRRPASTIRALAIGSAAVFVLGAVMSIGIAANTPSDAPLPTDLQVTAHQLMWAPEEITLDGSTGLWIDNLDGVRHTFTIPQLGVDIEIPGLKARRIDIDAAPGEYQIICKVPGHEAMTGTLTITS